VLDIQTLRLVGVVAQEPKGLMQLLGLMPVEMVGLELHQTLLEQELFTLAVEAEGITPQVLQVLL
jgi:hypothetical protein